MKIKLVKKALIKMFFSGEAGLAMVTTVVFTGALLVLGGAVATFAVNERQITAYNNSDIRLYYIVEGGLETGLAALYKDFNYNTEIGGLLGGGTYTLYFSDEYRFINQPGWEGVEHDYFENRDDVRFIQCIGTLGEHSKAMSIAVRIDEEGRVRIMHWYRIYPSH